MTGDARESTLNAWKYASILIAALAVLLYLTHAFARSGALAQRRSIEFEILDALATQLARNPETVEKLERAEAFLDGEEKWQPTEFLTPDGAVPGVNEGSTRDVAKDEFVQARAGLRGWRVSVEPAEMLVLVRRIVIDGETRGYLRRSIPMEDVLADHATVHDRILTSFLFVALLVIAVVLWVANQAAGPLVELRRHLAALAAGDYERVPPDLKSRELRDCVDSLSRFSSDLLARIQTGVRDREDFETILTSMGEGLLAIDLDEKVILINEPAKRIIGLPPTAAVPDSLGDLSRNQRLNQAIRTCMTEGRAFSEEIDFDGGRQNVVAQLTPLKAEHEAGGGAVCLLSDVTTMRRLENMRRDFVANVSHELKTPLTAIQGAAETILGDERMAEDVRQRFVSRILENSRRLDSLINDVLELSRLQSSGDMLDMESIDVRSLTRESLSQLEETAQWRGVELTTELGEEEVRVHGDRRSLRSVVDNLVTNALNYTPRGGIIRVRLFRDRDHVILEVEDDGRGIAAEHQERIFERFYRVDGARSRSVGGTGLGLAIVKNSVLAHSGQIEVESELGQGSTFRVRLPGAVSVSGQTLVEGGERPAET